MFSIFQYKQRKELKKLKSWTKSHRFLHERVHRHFVYTPYSVMAYWRFGHHSQKPIILYEEFSWKNVFEHLKNYEANVLAMDLAERRSIEYKHQEAKLVRIA